MENKLPVYQKLARFIKELRDAEESLDRKQTALCKARIAFTVSYYMPDDRSDLKSVKISMSESQPEKLVFYCTLEHRDEDGGI